MSSAHKPRGRPTTRDGVKGTLVHVAPKDGYYRFVPDKYEKDDDDGPKRRGGRSGARRGR